MGDDGHNKHAKSGNKNTAASGEGPRQAKSEAGAKTLVVEYVFHLIFAVVGALVCLFLILGFQSPGF